jgi:hypothetical protein
LEIKNIPLWTQNLLLILYGNLETLEKHSIHKTLLVNNKVIHSKYRSYYLLEVTINDKLLWFMVRNIKCIFSFLYPSFKGYLEYLKIFVYI